jgi:replicative DNA helicase
MNDYIVTHNTRAMIADMCTFGCDERYSKQEGKWINIGSGEPSLFIATEQDLSEVQTMMIAFISDVNEEHILYGNYDDGEWERVVKAAEILRASPIQVKYLPDFSMKDIENAIRLSIRENDVRYVCMDYIHSSMKILSEVSGKAGIKGLREDNVLFMLSTKLKEICNEYGVFIMTGTQLNGSYADTNIYDQNLLRGAKSIADRVDGGAILLRATPEDLEKLKPITAKLGIAPPDIKLSIYKNRRGRWKDIILWCQADLGTCKINPKFVTNYNFEYIPIENILVKVKPKEVMTF